MGQIAKTNFKIINSNRPTQLIGTTEPGVLLDIDNVESGSGDVCLPALRWHSYLYNIHKKS